MDYLSSAGISDSLIVIGGGSGGKGCEIQITGPVTPASGFMFTITWGSGSLFSETVPSSVSPIPLLHLLLYNWSMFFLNGLSILQ